MSKWMAIAIGNSRIRVAAFEERRVLRQWCGTPSELDRRPPWTNDWQSHSQRVVLVSVVPHQSTPWHHAPQLREITLADIPLGNLYPTMGVDRALVALGAGLSLGFPVLAVDCGTAVSITAIGGDRQLMGGMILPGLALQFRSLHEGTAALPMVSLPPTLPSFWARDTTGAIQSGTTHGLRFGLTQIVEQWHREVGGGGVPHRWRCRGTIPVGSAGGGRTRCPLAGDRQNLNFF